MVSVKIMELEKKKESSWSQRERKFEVLEGESENIFGKLINVEGKCRVLDLDKDM